MSVWVCIKTDIWDINYLNNKFGKMILRYVYLQITTNTQFGLGIRFLFLIFS